MRVRVRVRCARVCVGLSVPENNARSQERQLKLDRERRFREEHEEGRDDSYRGRGR